MAEWDTDGGDVELLRLGVFRAQRQEVFRDGLLILLRLRDHVRGGDPEMFRQFGEFLIGLPDGLVADLDHLTRHRVNAHLRHPRLVGVRDFRIPNGLSFQAKEPRESHISRTHPRRRDADGFIM